MKKMNQKCFFGEVRMRCGSNDKVNPVPYVLFCLISFIASKLIWRSINRSISR